MVIQIRPETALKRAEDLLLVEKKEDALDALHDLITQRGARNNRHTPLSWTPIWEKIIIKLVELCVDLKQPNKAKDSLWQYRNLTQQVNVQSLKAAIMHYLHTAEQRVSQAQKESHEVVENIDDLDQAESPENLLLSAVSSADTQDRADRAVLSPWLRFLWDSYRNCLELLRNNAAVEELYHTIARNAFDFCQKYQRRTEFRKLCETLRMHLNQVQKAQHFIHGVKLSNPETLAAMQETRINQLEVAINMEMWQEAFKSSDDVWQIFNLSREKDRRTVKTQTYVNFYERLALVFWQSNNQLFHAATLIKLYQMFKDMRKSFTQDEACNMATRCILAVLSIAPGADTATDLARHLDMEEQYASNQLKLAQLLDLKAVPTRKTLLRDIGRLSMIDVAAPPAKILFNQLECDFAPLQLANRTEEQLKAISECDKADWKQYVEQLRQSAAMRILRQVAQVYESIKIDRLSRMIPFMERQELERFVVFAGKKGFVQVHIDHRANTFVFAGDSKTGYDERQEVDGTHIDKLLPSDEIRGYLQSLYVALRDSEHTIHGESIKANLLQQLYQTQSVAVKCALDDHKHILARRKRIEDYKELREKERYEIAENEKKIAALRDEQRRREEQDRLKSERELFEQRRVEEERVKLKIKMNKDKIENLKASKIGQMIVEEYDEEQLLKMDQKQLLDQQKEKMDKERRDQIEKQRNNEKKWDYWVRALHNEEIPFRQKYIEEWRANDEAEFAELEKLRVANAISEHETQCVTYERLQRVKEDADAFLEANQAIRVERLAERQKAWREKLEKTREKRILELKQKELNRRRAEWEADKKRQEEEAEMRRRQEEDEKRNAGRSYTKGREGGGRDRMAELSKADTTDWRARDATPPMPAGGPPMSRGGPPMDDGPRGGPVPVGAPDRYQGARAADRTAGGMPVDPRRQGAPASGADQSHDWRAKPEMPPQQQQQQQPPIRHEPSPPVQQPPHQPSAPVSAAAAPPADNKPAKWVPPHLRNKMESGGVAPPPAAAPPAGPDHRHHEPSMGGEPDTEPVTDRSFDRDRRGGGGGGGPPMQRGGGMDNRDMRRDDGRDFGALRSGGGPPAPGGERNAWGSDRRGAPQQQQNFGGPGGGGADAGSWRQPLQQQPGQQPQRQPQQQQQQQKPAGGGAPEGRWR